MAPGDAPGSAMADTIRVHSSVQEATFDRRAATYPETGWRLAAARALVQWVSPRLNGRVLDVCTGSGSVIDAALAIDPSLRCVGVDISSQMLSRASGRLLRRTSSPVFFVRGDAQTLAFITREQFDVALCCLGMSYLHAPGEALHSFARMLKPGGLFAYASLSTENPPLFAVLRDLFLTERVHLPDRNLHCGSPKWAERSLRNAGLISVVTSSTHVTISQPEALKSWEIHRMIFAQEFSALTSNQFSALERKYSRSVTRALRKTHGQGIRTELILAQGQKPLTPGHTKGFTP